MFLSLRHLYWEKSDRIVLIISWHVKSENERNHLVFSTFLFIRRVITFPVRS